MDVTDADIIALQAKGIEVREHSAKNSQFGKNEKITTFDSFFIKIQNEELVITETENDMVILDTLNFKNI